MNTLNSLKAVLEPISIYDIKQSSIIYAELSAYSEGLDLLKNELSIAERECFISTAQTYGLLLREHLMGVLKSTLPVEYRREMLLHYVGVSEKSFTKASIEKALVSCGVVATISEYPSEYKIYINCVKTLDTTLTQEQIKNEAYKYLPPYLEAVFDFRKFNWNIIDSKSMTFEQMDSKNMMWSDIEKYEEE